MERSRSPLFVTGSRSLWTSTLWKSLAHFIQGSRSKWLLSRSCRTLTLHRRILRASNHEDVTEIDRPLGGIVNIAVAEPSRFRVLRHYISSKEHGAFVLASLTGVVTGFSNDVDKPCYINVKPFFHSWPRFAAVLKGVCEADSLFFHTRLYLGRAVQMCNAPGSSTKKEKIVPRLKAVCCARARGVSSDAW